MSESNAIRESVEPFLKGVTDLEGLLQVRDLIQDRINELERAKVYAPKRLDLRRFHLPKYLQAAVESEAEKIHNEWAALRIAQGWKWGPKRDDEKKEHPCLVPWEELPEEEKEYDRATALAAITNLLRDGWLIIKRQAISHPDEYGWLDELQPELYPGLDPEDRFYELSDEEFEKLYGEGTNSDETEEADQDVDPWADVSLNISWGEKFTKNEGDKIEDWISLAHRALVDLQQGDPRITQIKDIANRIRQQYAYDFFMAASDLLSEVAKKL